MVLIVNNRVDLSKKAPEPAPAPIKDLPGSIKASSFVVVNRQENRDNDQEKKDYGSTVAPKPDNKSTERRFSYYQDMKTVQQRS